MRRLLLVVVTLIGLVAGVVVHDRGTLAAGAEATGDLAAPATTNPGAAIPSPTPDAPRAASPHPHDAPVVPAPEPHDDEDIKVVAVPARAKPFVPEPDPPISAPAPPPPRSAPRAAWAPPPGHIVPAYAGPQIERYARYEGQTACDPTPKPGTLSLRDMLLAAYPATRGGTLGRDCSIGGRSEHKEGRAFDWVAHVNDPVQNGAVAHLMERLLATDAHGHQHALARRLGIMYMIWNHRIWTATGPNAGWQEYGGGNPHTDHVHFSLSPAGGRGETSFWSGRVPPELLWTPPPVATPRPPRWTPPTPTPTATPTPSPTPSPTPTPTGEPAA